MRCYPEHWDEALWPDDARRMRETGLRPGLAIPCPGGGAIERWLDEAETGSGVEAEILTGDGTVAVCREGRLRDLATWPQVDLARRVLALAASDAGLATTDLPEGVRTRSAGEYRFAFNYSREPQEGGGFGLLEPSGGNIARR